MRGVRDPPPARGGGGGAERDTHPARPREALSRVSRLSRDAYLLSRAVCLSAYLRCDCVGPNLVSHENQHSDSHEVFGKGSLLRNEPQYRES